MDSRLIFWLHELGREDVHLVGQKCAFLGISWTCLLSISTTE